MNKQVGPNRIEWTDFTWNPTGGCLHECAWTMPDGSTANCYAEDTAQGVARAAYPQGFDHHYWRPHLLKEPLSRREPSKIFIGSMADLFGAWVPSEQIQAVLDMCEAAHWHTFQILTKNAPRLLQFKFPPNVWVGVSSPPSFMNGKVLLEQSRVRMFVKSLQVLSQLAVPVTFMSLEPLPEGFALHLQDHGWRSDKTPILKWAILGAASKGPIKYQPSPLTVRSTVIVLNMMNVPVFFKGNLRGNDGVDKWREEFPQVAPAQPSLF